ncbi:hypothetical protein A3B42_02755 [Candidatus Daviesbacteria bacterium RIFCSPLOWO2_01_FULL_38_10]|nr:MAG: hypothetical protein A3B42_02755 [Candidatus Daviesbacteria bacterium RIFCSPLOWO2_01_FULL_38_10]
MRAIFLFIVPLLRDRTKLKCFLAPTHPARKLFFSHFSSLMNSYQTEGENLIYFRGFKSAALFIKKTI